MKYAMFVGYERETEKAILIEGNWFPKSQILVVSYTKESNQSTINSNGIVGVLVPSWLARKNGFNAWDCKEIEEYQEIFKGVKLHEFTPYTVYQNNGYKANINNEESNIITICDTVEVVEPIEVEFNMLLNKDNQVNDLKLYDKIENIINNIASNKGINITSYKHSYAKEFLYYLYKYYKYEYYYIFKDGILAIIKNHISNFNDYKKLINNINNIAQDKSVQNKILKTINLIE